MRLALRPYVTAGVAIVGAGVIAATPITATAPEIQNRAVTLSAAVQNLDLPSPVDVTPYAAVLDGSSFVNPVARWAEVIALTVTRVNELANAVMADPAPVLRQIIANQTGYAELIGTSLSTTVQNAINLVSIYMPDYLEEIRAQLEAGDISTAGNTLGNSLITIGSTFFPMLDLLKIPNEIVGNLSAVLDEFAPKSFRDLGLVGLAGMGTLYAAVGYVKSGMTPIVKNLYDAVQTGDMVKLVSTIINVPADTVSSILNGSYVPPNRPGRPGYWTDGLLTAGAWAPLHSVLVDIPKAIAAVIAPPAASPTAVSDLESITASTGSGSAVPDGTSTAITAADAGSTGVADSPSAAQPVTTEKAEPATEPGTVGKAEPATVETSATDSGPESSAPEAATSPDIEADTPAATPDKVTTKPAKSLVRDSMIAIPGRAGVDTDAGKKVVKSVAAVGDRVSATIERIGDTIGQKIRKALDKPVKQTGPADADSGKSPGDAE